MTIIEFEILELVFLASMFFFVSAGFCILGFWELVWNLNSAHEIKREKRTYESEKPRVIPNGLVKPTPQWCGKGRYIIVRLWSRNIRMSELLYATHEIHSVRDIRMRIYWSIYVQMVTFWYQNECVVWYVYRRVRNCLHAWLLLPEIWTLYIIYIWKCKQKKLCCAQYYIVDFAYTHCWSLDRVDER